MNRSVLAIVLALGSVGMMTVGCCTKQQQQIDKLTQENAVLLSAKSDLEVVRGKLAQAQEQSDELGMLIQSKETEITGLKAKVADLEARTPTVVPPPKGPVPPGWQETATGAKITLGSDILFSAGRATLTKEGAAALRQIAGTIKSAYPTAMVRVYGFTDSDPIVKSRKLWSDNLDLSANRAMAVTRQLRKLGISAANIETVAMGKERPVMGNTSKAAKAKNRRVEIAVVKR